MWENFFLWIEEKIWKTNLKKLLLAKITSIKKGTGLNLYLQKLFTARFCMTIKIISYRITSNKRRGRSFNFPHFLGGVYSREAFITKYRKNYNSIYQRQWFRCLLLSEKRHSLLHQRLESVIISNELGRQGSFNTSSCDINCCLPFWQDSPSLKQWIKPSSEPLVLRLKPHDLNELKKGGGGGGGRLFEGGVYKIICEKRGAFIRGRRFLEVGRLFEAIRYAQKKLGT